MASRLHVKNGTAAFAILRAAASSTTILKGPCSCKLLPLRASASELDTRMVPFKHFSLGFCIEFRQSTEPWPNPRRRVFGSQGFRVSVGSPPERVPTGTYLESSTLQAFGCYLVPGQGCGIKGFIPTSVIQGNPLFKWGVVFGRPFLLYHRSGFHFPQPCSWQDRTFGNSFQQKIDTLAWSQQEWPRGHGGSGAGSMDVTCSLLRCMRCTLPRPQVSSGALSAD